MQRHEKKVNRATFRKQLIQLNQLHDHLIEEFDEVYITSKRELKQRKEMRGSTKKCKCLCLTIKTPNQKTK